jgi:ABC-type spermidine/putrescine transport system permease subunit II
MNGLVLRGAKGLYAVLLILFLVLPSLVVVPLAFSTSAFLQFPPPGYSTDYFQQFFADPEWVGALRRSITVALCAALIAVPLGFAASWWLIRSMSRAKRPVETMLLLPMMVPVVVVGFGLYLLLLKTNQTGSLPAVVVAHSVLALPVVVLTLTAALRTFDFRLVDAARICGASVPRAVISVVLPVIFPALGAATLIALMTSLDEAVISTFLVGDTSPTLPTAMFNSITYDLNPLVPVAATLLTGLTLLLLLVSGGLTLLTRRRANAAALTTRPEGGLDA